MNLHRIMISSEGNFRKHPLVSMVIKRAVLKTLRKEKIPCSCEVSILLTDDDLIRKLNSEYRSVDRSTDVLSFPVNELVPGAFVADDCEVNFDSGRVILGDVVISVPHCEKQAIEYGHSFYREVTYLTVHSVLHLLGYDHTDEGVMKKQMRSREKEILGER